MIAFKLALDGVGVPGAMVGNAVAVAAGSDVVPAGVEAEAGLSFCAEFNAEFKDASVPHEASPNSVTKVKDIKIKLRFNILFSFQFQFLEFWPSLDSAKTITARLLFAADSKHTCAMSARATVNARHAYPGMNRAQFCLVDSNGR